MKKSETEREGAGRRWRQRGHAENRMNGGANIGKKIRIRWDGDERRGERMRC